MLQTSEYGHIEESRTSRVSRGELLPSQKSLSAGGRAPRMGERPDRGNAGARCDGRPSRRGCRARPRSPPDQALRVAGRPDHPGSASRGDAFTDEPGAERSRSSRGQRRREGGASGRPLLHTHGGKVDSIRPLRVFQSRPDCDGSGRDVVRDSPRRSSSCPPRYGEARSGERGDCTLPGPPTAASIPGEPLSLRCRRALAVPGYQDPREGPRARARGSRARCATGLGPRCGTSLDDGGRARPRALGRRDHAGRGARLRGRADRPRGARVRADAARDGR